MLGFTHSLGLNPFSYLQEKEGAITHEIAPAPGMDKSISSNGSDTFMFHSDGAYLSRYARPHTLSLLCLVNSYSVSTDIVSLDKCIRDLSQHEIDILSDRLFIHQPPETFRVGNINSESSILDRVDGFYEIKGALHSTRALTREAETVLQKLKSLMNEHKISNNWQPGDLLIFNNLRTMHGRGAISGSRWLQRYYGCNCSYLTGKATS